MNRSPFRGSQRGIAGLLIVAVAGCATPQYDAKTDELLTQLQKDVDTEFVTLISLDRRIAGLSGKADSASTRDLAEAKRKAGYAANIQFYDSVDVELGVLKTRIDAEPSLATPKLDVALQALRDNLLAENGSLIALHQLKDIIPEDDLRISQQIVDAQIGALLTRELQLKTGQARP